MNISRLRLCREYSNIANFEREMYMCDKRLTIIVPVYNAQKHLLDCIKSIIEELDNSMECFFIDDGSTDSSYHLMLPYAANNIHIIHQDNHGVSYTRNMGITMSSGEYIMFIDADDKLIPGWSECFSQAYEYGADIVYFSEKYLGDDVPEKKELLNRLFGLSSAVSNLAAPWAKIYKKTLFDKNDLTFHNDIIYGEDMLLNLQSILCADKIKSYSKSIYLYRNNLESVSHTFNKKWFHSNLIFLHKIEEILNNAFPKADADRYVSFSLYNSIELYIKSLCRISNDDKRLNHLMKLRDDQIRKYMKKYSTGSLNCYSKFILNLVACHHDKIANFILWCMRRVIILKRRIKGNNVQEWQRI